MTNRDDHFSILLTPRSIFMKYLPLLVIPLVLYVVGLMSGPMVGSWFVNEAVEDTTMKRDVKIGDAVFHIDLTEMRDNALPTTVRTVGPVKLPTVVGDGEVALADGREVKLLNRNDKKLIIETIDGTAKGEVLIKQTDIFATIGRRKMDELRAAAGGTKVPPVAPNLKPEPAPPVIAAHTEKPAPAPAPVMPPSEPMIPDSAPEPAPVEVSKLNAEQIVDLMKKSIADGAVKEFKSEQVQGWKAGEDEDVDGEEYQTGLVAYEAMTIFGKQAVQAKALIQQGKVVRWVYAKTGMEIR